MLPLALIVQAQGGHVAGSDRALDQGRTAQKFEFLRARGIELFPQDGSGVTRAGQMVVISAAVEASVPDVVAAQHLGARIVTRAELLADLFNAAPLPIGIAGTSGKSTTTGMVGWILNTTGRHPTVMNGAVMKNFITPSVPIASAVVGEGDCFVSEVDESDGSIALYRPQLAVVTNIALDHKSLDELRALFAAFVAGSDIAVLNLDNVETAVLASHLPPHKARTFSLNNAGARFFGTGMDSLPDGVRFELRDAQTGVNTQVKLRIPGIHNVQNALAAIAAACACDVPLREAASALEGFLGLRRRYETVGTTRGITVIDDFAHNPDKIAATLSTARQFPGRLLLLFQPHGFGPLRLMKNGLIEAFVTGMRADDMLVMPDPLYYGGTTERSVMSKDIVDGVAAHGLIARAIASRDECGHLLADEARSGDRIIIMGARDDTLATFASGILATIAAGSDTGS